MFADAHIWSLGYLWSIVNIIWNVRGNLSVVFTTRQTSKRIFDNQQIMLTVSDRIQIPSKTTHEDTGTKVNKYMLLIY